MDSAKTAAFDDMFNVLSLGAGVQSSTIALMSAGGELPRLDAAVFADTGAEPAGVYAWLEWLEAEVNFPVYRVQRARWPIQDHARIRTARDGHTYMETTAPYWTFTGGARRGGLRRKCTRDYKIRPITAQVRKLAAVPRGAREPVVRQWIGISLDEVVRMKRIQEPWVETYWPLIDARMTRAACIEWMRRNGYPDPPRSACYFCPFHSPREWARLQADDPESYNKAAAHEARVRALLSNSPDDIDAEDIFCSQLGRPLAEIDWAAEIGKMDRAAAAQLDLWGNECEGMCGV